MLFSSLAHAHNSSVESARMQAALEFLARPDLAELECGRHEIMGDEVFANVMEFETVDAAEKAFEAHRRYTDVHFVISGEEHLCVAPVDECEPLGEFKEEDDFGLYLNPGRSAWVTLRAGDLVVTPPEDAHKPGCCGDDDPAPLKKICVKVLVG